jgi:hypothetical protein
MAIALLDDELFDHVPWPRPELRLVPAPGEVGWVGAESRCETDADRSAGGPLDDAPVLVLPWTDAGDRFTEDVPADGVADATAEEAVAPRLGVDVSVRRRVRTTRRIRRRRTAVALLVAGVVTVLCLPVSAVAGRAASTPSAGAAAGAAASATQAGTSTYVVQPGDTLWSVAERIDHGGDPRALVAALENRLGTATVHAGERIQVP